MNPRKPPNKGGFSYAPKNTKGETRSFSTSSLTLSSDNPGPRAQGMRQAFGGGVIVLIGTTLVPMLKTMLG
jgi:hypothetical protein